MEVRKLKSFPVTYFRVEKLLFNFRNPNRPPNSVEISLHGWIDRNQHCIGVGRGRLRRYCAFFVETLKSLKYLKAFVVDCSSLFYFQFSKVVIKLSIPLSRMAGQHF